MTGDPFEILFGFLMEFSWDMQPRSTRVSRNWVRPLMTIEPFRPCLRLVSCFSCSRVVEDNGILLVDVGGIKPNKIVI